MLSSSRRTAVLGLVAALAVVVGVIAMQAWSPRPGDTRPVAGSAAGAAGAEATDWLAVITELDTARAQALSTADPALLDRVYTATSAQRSADSAVVTDLAAKGLRVRSATHQIVSATIAPDAGAGPAASNLAAAGAGTSAANASPDGPGSSTVRVAVVDSMPSYPIVDTAGNSVGQTAARTAERRILVLAATPQGYRIESILAG